MADLGGKQGISLRICALYGKIWKIEQNAEE